MLSAEWSRLTPSSHPIYRQDTELLRLFLEMDLREGALRDSAEIFQDKLSPQNCPIFHASRIFSLLHCPAHLWRKVREAKRS